MRKYINRKALEAKLNRRLSDLFKEYGEHDHYSSGYDECVDAVENFPDADVAETVYGIWEESPICESMLSICSVCGFNCGSRSFLYCPMCGAKMFKRRNTAAEKDI